MNRAPPNHTGSGQCREIALDNKNGWSAAGRIDAADLNPPTVSVVLPIYNRADVIERAIRSVLEQTYSDFEVIVVDDGSTDNTVEIVKGIDDARIRLLVHEENRGAAAARNTGIRAAKGDYIAFQDSDDEWEPQKLEKQMCRFRQVPDDVGVVYSWFYEISDDGQQMLPRRNRRPMEGDIQSVLLNANFITTQVAVVRRRSF